MLWYGRKGRSVSRIKQLLVGIPYRAHTIIFFKQPPGYLPTFVQDRYYQEEWGTSWWDRYPRLVENTQLWALQLLRPSSSLVLCCDTVVAFPLELAGWSPHGLEASPVETFLSSPASLAAQSVGINLSEGRGRRGGRNDNKPFGGSIPPAGNGNKTYVVIFCQLCLQCIPCLVISKWRIYIVNAPIIVQILPIEARNYIRHTNWWSKPMIW